MGSRGVSTKYRGCLLDSRNNEITNIGGDIIIDSRHSGRSDGRTWGGSKNTNIGGNQFVNGVKSRKQQSYSKVLTRQFFSTLIAQDVFCSFTQGQSLSNGSPSFVGGAQNPSWFWAGKNRPKQQLVSREDLDDEPYSPSYTGERMAHVESVEEGNGSSDESLPEIADPPEYVVPLPLFTK